MLVIVSRSGWFSARLADGQTGVEVEVYQHLPGNRGAGLRKRVHRETFDCPMHIACDRMQALLDRLQRPLAAPRDPYRVRSIIR